MACDIHLYVERRVEGRWVTADTWQKDEYDNTGQRLEVPYEKRFYRGRNYNLFAILADVRNGRGFAGIVTGAGFNPIVAPKGLPTDVCQEVAAESEMWGADGHSHSHFTLRELLDYDWTQVTQLQGWVNFQAWEKWSRWSRNEGRGPDGYCGRVSGRDVKHLDEAQMDALLKEYRQIQGSPEHEEFMVKHSATYALAQWQEPYYRAAKNFLSETVPRLLALARGTAGLDDVRIVFWFDN